MTSRDQSPLSPVGTGMATAVLTGLLSPVTSGAPVHMLPCACPPTLQRHVSFQSEAGT